MIQYFERNYRSLYPRDTKMWHSIHSSTGTSEGCCAPRCCVVVPGEDGAEQIKSCTMRRTRDSLAIHHQPWDVLNYFEYIKKLLKGCPRRLTSPSIPHHPTDRPDRPGPLVDDNDALCWTWLLMNVGVLNYIIKFQHNRKGQTTERKSRGGRRRGRRGGGGW